LRDERDAFCIHDGPNDLPVELTALGRTLVIPYRRRKLRFLGSGWAVVAGDLASGSLVLDELRDAKAAGFEPARARLDQVRDALEARATRETGVQPQELRKTFVIGGEYADAPSSVWTVGMAPGDQRTSASRGPFAANTPQDVPASVWAAAYQAFHDEVGMSFQRRIGIGFVKAAAKLVAEVSRHTQEASARAQIGVTLKDPAGLLVSRYFDGLAEDLLRLGPNEFMTASEAA
jgi:hypothetical protein